MASDSGYMLQRTSDYLFCGDVKTYSSSGRGLQVETKTALMIGKGIVVVRTTQTNQKTRLDAEEKVSTIAVVLQLDRCPFCTAI